MTESQRRAAAVKRLTDAQRRDESLRRLDFAKETGKVMATDDQIRMRPTWALKSMVWDNERQTFKRGMENSRAARELKRRIDLMHVEETRALIGDTCHIIERRVDV